MIVFRATADAEVDYDLWKKRFARGLPEVLGNVERKPVVPPAQRRGVFVEVSHPSLFISHSRSDNLACMLEHDSDPLCRPAKCRIQHVRAERAHASSPVI